MSVRLPYAATYYTSRSRQAVRMRGWVFEDANKAMMVVSSLGEIVPLEGVFDVNLDGASTQAPPQCVIDEELAKFGVFYKLLESVSTNGLREPRIVRVQFGDTVKIPPRFFAKKGTHSDAVKVGFLMQFLFQPDPAHYFHKLRTLFPSPADVLTFFPIQFDGIVLGPTVSQAISTAFSCAVGWNEIVLAVTLQSTFNPTTPLDAELWRVRDLQAGGAPDSIKVLLSHFADLPPDVCGRCVAQLMRIAQTLPPTVRNNMWREVCETHGDNEPFWEGVRSALCRMQERVGAVVSKSDLFGVGQPLALLRAGARVCPRTRDLLAATFADLIDGPQLAAFLTVMLKALLVVPTPTRMHILRLFAETNVSPKQVVANAQCLLCFSIHFGWEWGVLKALRQRGRGWNKNSFFPRMTAAEIFECLETPHLRILVAEQRLMNGVTEWAAKASATVRLSELLAVARRPNTPELLLRGFFKDWLLEQAPRKIKNLVDELGAQAPSFVFAVFLDELFKQCTTAVATKAVTAAFTKVAASGLVAVRTLSHFHINVAANRVITRIRKACEDPFPETISAMLDFPGQLGQVEHVLGQEDAAEIRRRLEVITSSTLALVDEANTLMGNFAALSKLVEESPDVLDYRMALASTDPNQTNVGDLQRCVQNGEKLLRGLFGEHAETIKRVLLSSGYRSAVFAVFAEREFRHPPPFRLRSTGRTSFGEVIEDVRKFLSFEGDDVDCYRVLRGIRVSEELKLLGACFPIRDDFQDGLKALLSRLRVLSHSADVAAFLTAMNVLNNRDDSDLLTELDQLHGLPPNAPNPEIVDVLIGISESQFELLQAVSAAPNLVRLLRDEYRISTDEGLANMSALVDRVKSSLLGFTNDGSMDLLCQLNLPLLSKLVAPVEGDGSVPKVRAFCGMLSNATAHFRDEPNGGARGEVASIRVLEDNWARMHRILQTGSALRSQRCAGFLREIHAGVNNGMFLAWHLNTNTGASNITLPNGDVLCSGVDLEDFLLTCACEAHLSDSNLKSTAQLVVSLARHVSNVLDKVGRLTGGCHPHYLDGKCMTWGIGAGDGLLTTADLDSSLEAWQRSKAAMVSRYPRTLLLPFRVIAGILGCADPRQRTAELSALLKTLFDGDVYRGHEWVWPEDLDMRTEEFCGVLQSCVRNAIALHPGHLRVVECTVKDASFANTVDKELHRDGAEIAYPFQVFVCSPFTVEADLLHFIDRAQAHPAYRFTLFGAHLLPPRLLELLVGVAGEHRGAMRLLVTVDGSVGGFVGRGWCAESVAEAAEMQAADPPKAIVVAGPSGSGKSFQCRRQCGEAATIRFSICDRPTMSKVVTLAKQLATMANEECVVLVNISEEAFGDDWHGRRNEEVGDEFAATPDQGILPVNDLLHQLVVDRLVVDPASGTCYPVPPWVAFMVEVCTPTLTADATKDWVRRLLPLLFRRCDVRLLSGTDLLSRLDLSTLKKARAVALFGMMCRNQLPTLLQDFAVAAAVHNDFTPFADKVDVFIRQYNVADEALLQLLRDIMGPEVQSSFHSIRPWFDVAYTRLNFLQEPLLVSWGPGYCPQCLDKPFGCSNEEHTLSPINTTLARLFELLVGNVNRLSTPGQSIDGEDTVVFLHDAAGYVVPYWRGAPSNPPEMLQGVELLLSQALSHTTDGTPQEYVALSMLLWNELPEKVRIVREVLDGMHFVLTPTLVARFAFLFDCIASRTFAVLQSATGVGKSFQLKATERLLNHALSDYNKNTLHRELYSSTPTCLWGRVFAKLDERYGLPPTTWTPDAESITNALSGFHELDTRAATRQFHAHAAVVEEIDALRQTHPEADWSKSGIDVGCLRRDEFDRDGVRSLIEHLENVPVRPLFHLLVLHFGVTEEDVDAFLDPIVELARIWLTRGGVSATVVVYFDELNATSIPAYLKVVTVDRRHRGKPVPDNVVFIGAINPHGDVDKYGVCAFGIAVNRRIRTLGSFGRAERNVYASKLLSTKCPAIGGFVTPAGNMLDVAHTFAERVRQQQPGKYGPNSQREIHHGIAACNATAILLTHLQEHEWVRRFRASPMVCAVHCFASALFLSYGALLDAGDRKNFFQEMDGSVISALRQAGDTTTASAHAAVKRLVGTIVNKDNFEIERGVSLTEGLSEILFIELVAIMTERPKMSVGICGIPGIGKTLSVRILERNMKGAESPKDFFKRIGAPLHVYWLQGSSRKQQNGLVTSRCSNLAHMLLCASMSLVSLTRSSRSRRSTSPLIKATLRCFA